MSIPYCINGFQNIIPSSHTYTTIIYGATAAGIVSAIELKKRGINVCIVEPTSHIGGMTTGGLCATDSGLAGTIGGLAQEFYRDIDRFYDRKEGFTFEPKVATHVIKKWILENDLKIYLMKPIEKVKKNKNQIISLITTTGETFKGDYFIDATYEGDLMALAGVSYTIGREGNTKYHEIYNGIQYREQHHRFEGWIDPYKRLGDPSSGLLYGIETVSPKKIGYPGKEDKSIQAYNFRICLTDDSDKLIPFSKPDDYDEERYELITRYINNGYWDAMNLNTPLPNHKFDLNNFGAVSTDLIGKNYRWPDGSYEERNKIFSEHLSYSKGLLYYLSNSKNIPEKIRREVAKFGLPSDEYESTNYWTPQLYIREARRMLSSYVMTEHNCLGKEKVKDPIGLASYHMDSHNCRRIVIDGRVVNEGDVEIPTVPFGISYKSIIPVEKECKNLIVPLALSSSHIAYGAIRMEPVFMILGQSAAIALDLCYRRQQSFQQLDYDSLRSELLNAGQLINWKDEDVSSSLKRMKNTFGKLK